jgi:hypothetical protein
MTLVDAQEIGSDCDHVQATNLRFNWIIIMELYNVRNMAGQGIERGDPGEKNMPRMVKFENSDSDSNTLYFNDSILSHKLVSIFLTTAY